MRISDPARLAVTSLRIFGLRGIRSNDENDAHEMTFSIRTVNRHAAKRNVTIYVFSPA